MPLYIILQFLQDLNFTRRKEIFAFEVFGSNFELFSDLKLTMTGMMMGNIVVIGILKLHLSPSKVRMKMTMFILSLTTKMVWMPGLEDTKHLLEPGLGRMDRFLNTPTGLVVNPTGQPPKASWCTAEVVHRLGGGMMRRLELGLMVMFVHTTFKLNSFECTNTFY